MSGKRGYARASRFHARLRPLVIKTNQLEALESVLLAW